MRTFYKVKYGLLASILSLGFAYGFDNTPISIEDWHKLEQSPQSSAEKIVKSMTIRQKIGQLLMMDIRKWQENGDEVHDVTQLPEKLANMINIYHIGSIILFRENLIDTPQTYNLIKNIQQARANYPLFIATDQEGGYVTRLRVGTEMPGNMATAATRDSGLAEETGKIHGAELQALGFNINFAPTVDVNTNQNNPVIGVRSYSSDPNLVVDMASAYIKGLNSFNVRSSLKHFPGHGNVATDSHFGLPMVNSTEEEWRKIDLFPFKTLLAQGNNYIVTAHINLPMLDDTKVLSKKDNKPIGLPATLSKKIITGILRDELKFDGLVFTDALEMGAISDNFGVNEASEMALEAGVDILMMPVKIQDQNGLDKLETLYQYLEQKIQTNPELAKRLDQSVERVLIHKLKAKLSLEGIGLEKAESLVGSKAHKEKERMIAQKAVTLIKNEEVLPFTLKDKDNIFIISDENTRNELITKMINQEVLASQQAKNITLDSFSMKLNDDSTIPSNVKTAINNSHFIILATYNLSQLNNNAQKIIDLANEHQKPLVVITTRNPYDIAYLKNVKANIAIYGITGFDVTNNNRNSLEANIRAGIISLFKGENIGISPTGKLPVDIYSVDGKEKLYPIGYGLSY